MSIDAEKWELFLLRLEIESQCASALTASGDLEEALAAGDRRRFWYSVQGLLIASANISKLLWGNDSAAAKRRSSLRRLLRVGDDSPLRNRRLRNHFEHFDERLEAWVRDAPGRGSGR
jgi:hypothetical protein